MICDRNGRIWHCSKKNYFVLEITLSSQSPELLRFLSLFPDWQCMGPNVVANFLKKNNNAPTGCQVTLIDQEEVESPEYQRVYAYLSKLDSKGKAQNLDDYKYTKINSFISWEMKRVILDIIMKYYSHPEPSWCELKHFISLFNNQLLECEHDNYTVRFSTKYDPSLKGFKTFLVECMIWIAKDFTIPSLKDSIGSSVDLIDGYGIESRREQKMHPYIFFNENRESMTFFGIHVTEDKEQIRRRTNEGKQLIGEKGIPKQLYNTLRHNNVEFDCLDWDRTRMIHILAKVMGMHSPPGPEFDPFYVLTII